LNAAFVTHLRNFETFSWLSLIVEPAHRSFGMRSLTRSAFAIAFSLACVSIVTSQDATKANRGSITGRVIAANKGVAGVTVTISMSGDALSGGGLTLKSITDDEGQFRISNLTAGTYYVWPFAPAFVVAEATGVYPLGKIVTLSEAETVEDVDFHLTHGAAITGRATDAAGRPVIDERVRILSTDPDLRRLASSIYPDINDIRTDDRGAYRVFGLPAGKYKVSIGDEYSAFASTKGRRFFPRTFHPDITDEAKAKVVEVTEGGEATNVDITVARPMTGFSASGRFIDGENGQPVPNISFGLTIIVGGRPSGFMRGNGVSTSDGGFRIDNLPPGRYAVSILPGSGSTYYGESPAFDITDSDVTDLEAKIRRSATISGNVVIEGLPDKSVLARLAQARVETVMWAEGTNIGTVSYANINPDGSFQIGPLQAGKATLRLSSSDRNAPAEFALLSVDLNGADKSQGIQLTAGENISGVRLVVGYGTGTIRGNIRTEGGTLSPGTYVSAAFLRPGNPFTIAYTRVDVRGRFVFERVPPGYYEVVVTAYLDNRRVTARQPVVASNGTITEVTVTLNLGETPPPKP
jgi:uncharacterized protein (DUF2141 family)